MAGKVPTFKDFRFIDFHLMASKRSKMKLHLVLHIKNAFFSSGENFNFTLSLKFSLKRHLQPFIYVLYSLVAAPVCPNPLLLNCI